MAHMTHFDVMFEYLNAYHRILFVEEEWDILLSAVFFSATRKGIGAKQGRITRCKLKLCS